MSVRVENRHRGIDSRRENTKGGLWLRIMSRATEREASRNRVKNWCVGLHGCVFPSESDWYTDIHPPGIQVNTHLLHPDSRSLFRSPEDHGFVHGGREQTERLFQLTTFRGRQRDTGEHMQEQHTQSIMVNWQQSIVWLVASTSLASTNAMSTHITCLKFHMSSSYE